MSESLDIRLKYRGGKNVQDRLIKDKLNTLRKALLYSYQSDTIVLADGREFRALINSDKLKNDYDNKILSIPFEDICLNKNRIGTTTEGREPTNIQVGDVFKWKGTETKWIIYLRYLEEKAYFRGEIRKCSSIATVNGIDYDVYMRGPVETTIRWNLKSDISWNDLNYSAIVYIVADENTSSLKRFSKMKLDGKNYEVQVVNRYGAGGTLIVYLKEDFTNTIEELYPQVAEELDINLYEIKGEAVVHPYDLLTYTIDTIEDGIWSINGSIAKINSSTAAEVSIEVTTGYPGNFEIIYTRPNGLQYVLPIKVVSF